MYIEDLLVKLSGCGVSASWTKIPLARVHISPVMSMAIQVGSNLPLTAKQADYAIHILAKYCKRLSTNTGQDIMHFLDNPKYKLGIRKIMTDKTISLSADKKCIELHFPYNATIIHTLHEYRKGVCNPHAIKWTGECWELQLDETQLMFINDVLLPDAFIASDDINALLTDINSIRENCDQYIPQLAYVNEEFVYKNAAKSVPPITSSDLLSVLFAAKTAGITTWDNSIHDIISESSLDETTIQVLKNTEKMCNVSSTNPIECLTSLVNHHSHILFIVPGAFELHSVTHCIDFLTTIGISNSAISVLFRLSNTTNKDFNSYVKNNKLNNPLSIHTKAAFVMGKLPKTVVEYDQEFDLVINLGMLSPHYILKDYIKNHNCVVNYDLTSKTKELNFDNL